MKSNQKFFKGRVLEVLPELKFKVMLDDGHEIVAYPAGKLRINFIKIIEGDYVLVELSPYDYKKGRIIKRL